MPGSFFTSMNIYVVVWMQSAPPTHTFKHLTPNCFGRLQNIWKVGLCHRKWDQTLGFTLGLYFPSSLCIQINPDVNMLLLPQPQATSSTTSLLPPTPYKASIYLGMLPILLTLTTCSHARPLSTAMSCSS